MGTKCVTAARLTWGAAQAGRFDWTPGRARALSPSELNAANSWFKGCCLYSSDTHSSPLRKQSSVLLFTAALTDHPEMEGPSRPQLQRNWHWVTLVLRGLIIHLPINPWGSASNFISLGFHWKAIMFSMLFQRLLHHENCQICKKRDVKHCHKTMAVGGFGIKTSVSTSLGISYSFDWLPTTVCLCLVC